MRSTVRSIGVMAAAAAVLLVAACSQGAPAAGTTPAAGSAASTPASSGAASSGAATQATTAATAKSTPTAAAKAAVASGDSNAQSFFSKCDQSTQGQAGQRYYAVMWKSPEGPYVSGGQLSVSLRTPNGTELNMQTVQVAQQNAISQGYLDAKSWTPANVGGELGKIVVSVAQPATVAQLPELAKNNPVDVKIKGVTFTTNGPAVDITTENKGEINAQFQVTGFAVNQASEIVSVFSGSGQAVAKSPVTAVRLQNTFGCAGLAPAPVTVYLQVRITQQAGSQTAVRTELLNQAASPQ